MRAADINAVLKSTSAQDVQVIQVDGLDHGTSVAFAFHPVHFDLE